MSRRGATQRILQARDKLLDKRKPRLLQFNAYLGDGNGNVVVDSSNPNIVYARELGRGVVYEVWNTSCPPIHNLPVVVGRSDEEPTTLQVLSIRRGALQAALVSNGVEYFGIGAGPHHESHEFRRTGISGSDIVYIAMEQITDGLVYPSGTVDLGVDVTSCWYAYGTGFHYFGGETGYDVSASVPGAANTCRWVLVYIDTTVDPHAIDSVDGDVFPANLFPPENIAMPDAPVGSVPLGAVFLEDTTVDLTWENVYSMRVFPSGVSGVVTSTAHGLLDDDVHDDVVDNDPVQGDIVYADATPEWDALAVGAAGAILHVSGGLPAWLALGAAGGILKVNAGATALEYLAIGARGGILKVDAAGTALEYLAAGNALDVLHMDAAGQDPEWVDPADDFATALFDLVLCDDDGNVLTDDDGNVLLEG